MKRAPSQSVIERNAPILEKIRKLKEEHPFWGYRRIWAYLKYNEKLEINLKRVYRLMKDAGLMVKPKTNTKANRTPRNKPKPSRPNEWWGIDMTKVMVAGFGWMYLVIVLDWYTKKIVGYNIGLQSKAKDWLEALDMGLNVQFPEGVRGKGLCLMSDNGCQPTAVSFMRACGGLEIKQAFTSYNNPKGNGDTERMIRTLKEELIWLREWDNPFELVEELKTWIEGYNRSYLHSALGYRTPNQTEAEYFMSQEILLPAY